MNGLFDARTRVRLLLLLVGSLAIAVAEAVAVVAVLPLMALATGKTPESSAQLRTVSDLLGEPSTSRLATYVAVLVLAGFVVKGLGSMAFRWWSIGFIMQQSIRTSSGLLNYYLKAPYSMHVRRGTPDLLRVLNEGSGFVYTAVVLGSISATTELITLAALSITLLVVNPLATVLVGTYFAAAAWLLQRAVKGRVRVASHVLLEEAMVSNKTTLQALGGIKEIQLRHEQDLMVDAYRASRTRAAAAQRSSSFLGEMPKYVLEILFVAGIGLMTVLAYAQNDPEQALGTIALFGVAGFRILPSMVRCLASITLVRTGVPALELVEADLVHAREEPPSDPTASERLPLEHGLVLDSLSFRYPDGVRDVLSNVSLSIPAGSSVAFVGSSGAGKTTLVDIILGFHRPTGGAVLADGQDVFDDLPRWRAGLAMVPQDVYLLDESLRDNIRFTAAPAPAPDPDLARAVEQAGLADVVADLPAGLDTEVGERGSRMSGGQRQRVGIARALYRNPTLLVLDEATSALDNETEFKVAQTMSTLRGEVTLVVVAHRLSTVKDCDTIVFLEDGKIRSQGSFSELRSNDSAFARLVALGSLDA
ncbi:ABC-type multidrug transport system fused ATPase/permease subunit [Nocardioides sp. BE266]|uniref:ABC transporter ATP-binding protein n=1 Tax=Nocardioides sp. BE266 TaxID=2817725 RepID=UPI00285F4FA7|nr:ABC transporter ATP-binding protein [Nocardioides sp. BE266]MDR7252137.1 ABC-type multidrug transport system fused ATPase/permease subunit [Nocardioides sp. BE266]